MYALPLKNILILLHFVWQNGTMNVCKIFYWKSVRDRNVTLCHMHPRYFKIFRYYNYNQKIKNPNTYGVDNLYGKSYLPFFLTGQSLGVAMSGNKEKCIQKTLYFLNSSPVPSQRNIWLSSCVTASEGLPRLWGFSVTKKGLGGCSHMGWREENSHIQAHGWLQLERENTFQSLSGCLFHCIPQPADDVS